MSAEEEPTSSVEEKKEQEDEESKTSSSTESSKPLISLTIKTLDSQNHKIEDVEEDLSVKDFKAKIADTVGITPERQRLIYCGRVLNDEKKLKEYSLNGKVIHLVQRQPPGTSGGPDRLAASEARARSRGASPSRRHQHHIHVHGPINASVNVGQPSMLVRLNLARSMLRRANICIDRLENPNGSPAAATEPSSNTTATPQTPQAGDGAQASTQSESSGSSETPETTSNTSTDRNASNERNSSESGTTMQFLAATGIPMGDSNAFGGMPPELAQAIQSAVNHAIHSSNMESNSGASETRSENGTRTRTVAMSFQVVDGQLVQTDNPEAGGPSDTSNPSNTRASSSSSNSGPTNPTRSPGAESTPRRNNPQMAVDHPPPRMMSEVMAEYRRTDQRLQPHWDRLDTMLQDDPAFETDEIRTQHQTLFRGVTEIMHFLSHAQHAMSDAMLDLGSTPPRQLRARPFVIAPIVQSAVVQNVPIQVPMTRGATRRPERTPSTPPAASAATASSEPATAAEPMETSESSSDSEPVTPTQRSQEQRIMQQIDAVLADAGAAFASRSSPSESNNDTASNQDSQNNQEGGATESADIEVSVEPIVVGIEMGPEITIDRQGRVTESSGNASNEGSPPASNAQMPRRGGAPSAGMIQNMIQAALSNMGARANVTVQEITPESLMSAAASSSNTNSPPNHPGQNSRARGNTQTNPTTSTRTRSTTQVINMPAGAMGPPMGFMGPNGLQGGPMGPVQPNHNFDILLPCNSHHIPQNAMHNRRMDARNRRMRPHPVFQHNQRPRSSSVPPRGPIRIHHRAHPPGANASGEGNDRAQRNVRSQPRTTATSASGSPEQSPRRTQQTAPLPGGGSVTIDFDSNFDLSSFFGRAPPPSAQRAAANARNNSSSRINLSGMNGGNNGASDLEPSLNNLLNVLQGANQNGGSQNGDNANNPMADALRQAISDDGMLNVIQGIVGQVMGAMGVPPARNADGGAVDSSPTISQFLESMPDYSYNDGEDIVTDFLMSLARVLTFRDLIGMVGGRGVENGLSNSSRDAIGRLQGPMQSFMRRRMFNGNDPEGTDAVNTLTETPGHTDIESAFLQLIDDSFTPHFEACAEIANVRENIDFAETLHNFLAVRLTQLASDCIWNNQLSNQDFGTKFYEEGFRFLSDLTRLCLMCFTDGQSSIERVVQNRLSNISDDVGSTVSQWTMSAAIGHLRNYVAGVIENGETDIDIFNRFVVRPEASASRRLARQQRIEARRNVASSIVDANDREVESVTNRAAQNDQQDEDETFETPRSSPEVMVTDNISPTRVPNGEMDVDVRPKLQNKPDATTDTKNTKSSGAEALIQTPDAPSSEELTFPTELLPRSQGIDMVVGRESWHRQVPPEWVPIITRDVQAQNQITPMAPYSDAYLSTQPAKKRRLAEAKKPEGSIEKVISDTLKDAIRVTGVQPKSAPPGGNDAATNSSIAGEVSVDGGVQAAIKNDTRGTIKRRLQQDPDFKPERFPDSQDFVAKK